MMTNHHYKGVVFDNEYHLFTDGRREIPLVASSFRWGCDPCRATFHAATRILSREIPVPAINEYVGKFDEQVVANLPTQREWTLSSRDIRDWLNGQSSAHTESKCEST